MEKIFVIFKKEVKGFLFNPNFLIVCGLAAVVMSWTYSIMLGQFNQALQSQVMQMQMPKDQLNIHFAVFVRHLSFLNFMLILIVPALTMRLFAEEKKMRTFDLLLTAPITSLQIVFGKYLAVLGALLCVTLLAFLYPLITGFFAQFQWSVLLIAFAGIFILSAVYAAMNLFCSALTESAIVSYVMAVIFNVAIWFIGMGVELVDSSLARQVFEHISLNQHLSAMIQGTIRSTGLIFFASLIILFTFLSERVVESSRWR